LWVNHSKKLNKQTSIGMLPLHKLRIVLLLLKVDMLPRLLQ
jgi:hypothetical protein